VKPWYEKGKEKTRKTEIGDSEVGGRRSEPQMLDTGDNFGDIPDSMRFSQPTQITLKGASYSP